MTTFWIYPKDSYQAGVIISASDEDAARKAAGEALSASSLPRSYRRRMDVWDKAEWLCIETPLQYGSDERVDAVALYRSLGIAVKASDVMVSKPTAN